MYWCLYPQICGVLHLAQKASYCSRLWLRQKAGLRTSICECSVTEGTSVSTCPFSNHKSQVAAWKKWWENSQTRGWGEKLTDSLLDMTRLLHMNSQQLCLPAPIKNPAWSEERLVGPHFNYWQFMESRFSLSGWPLAGCNVPVNDPTSVPIWEALIGLVRLSNEQSKHEVVKEVRWRRSWGLRL